MKFVVLQENLEKALQLATKVASQKSELPITQNTLLRASVDGIEIITTDLENTAHVKISGKVDEDGSIALPTKTLLELVSMLPKDQITITQEGLRVSITAPKYESFINGISADEFPELPVYEEMYAIPVSDVLSNSKTISFSASNEESGRVELSGVYITFSDGKATVVGTDGYRLSLKTIPISTTVKEGTSFIIPSRMFSEVAKIAQDRPDQEAQFIVGGSTNQAVFRFTDCTIYTRLIEGNYPKFDKILPSSYSTRVVFEKEELIQAVRVTAVFARESANIIKFLFTKQGVVLSANASQVGENRCEIDIPIEGEENEIAFNSRFLLEFLNLVPTKEIVFEMTGPLNPGVFRIPGEDNYLHIIMPVKVQG